MAPYYEEKYYSDIHAIRNELKTANQYLEVLAKAELVKLGVRPLNRMFPEAVTKEDTDAKKD